MELELFYFAKPWRINQAWGIHRPEIYSQFGFTDHNGIDVALGTNKLVMAELPCQMYKTGFQPNGGGVFCTVVSQHEYDFEDGKRCHVMIDYLHLENITATIGQKLDVGDIIAKADNTGFSTGPHTHAQYRRVHKTVAGITNVDKNDANNSFNPEVFRNGKFAQDVKLSALAATLKALLALLSTLKA